MGVFDSFPPIVIGMCLILATVSVFVHAGWCVRDEVRRLRRVETKLSQDEAGSQEGGPEASNNTGDDVHGLGEQHSETQMMSLSDAEAPTDGFVHRQGGDLRAIAPASKETTASPTTLQVRDVELVSAGSLLDVGGMLCGGIEPLPGDAKSAHVSDAGTTVLLQRIGALVEELATKHAMKYTDGTALAEQIYGVVAKELAVAKAKKEATDKAEAS